MGRNGIAIAICLVVLVLPSGCSVISKQFGLGKKSAVKGATVSVTPWLGQPAKIPMSTNLTLPEVLQTPAVAAQRTILLAVAKGLAQTSNLATHNFEDNCVVLVRGNEHWYFLEPTSLLDLYVSVINLKANDKIYTIPLRLSKFVTPMHQSNFQIALIEPGRPAETVLVTDTDAFPMAVSALQTQPPASWWTLSVVTRVEVNQFHHLVLPANFEPTSPLHDPLSFSAKLSATNGTVYFQPGDILEKTNIVQFVNRL